MGKKLDVLDLTVEIEDQGKYYCALDQVSFQVEPGEIAGLVGESGCGKSLSSLAIMGLLPQAARVSKGSISLGETNLLELTEKEFCGVRGEDISMIFQEPMTALNPLVTVGKQIEEAYMLHHGKDRETAYQKALEMMKKVGLPRAEELYREYPHQLSGGMKQRIVIAMALMNHPGFIVADEPTTALDATIQYQILELIRKLNREFDCSVLFISHDLGVVKELCSKVIVMYAGSIVEEGKTEEILLNPMHPYTKGLLESIPVSSKKGTDLYNIPGMVEPLNKRNPVGCKFAARCPIAEKNCFTIRQVMQERNGRRVSCMKAGLNNA